MELKAREKVEMMRKGATIRPLVSFAVEEALEVFNRCSGKRDRLLLQGCSPPFFLSQISDSSIIDAIELVRPITDRNHLIRILDVMDIDFLNHPNNVPKSVK
tara:strand:- start:36796 stop:37101 length:306 start_codon:yes stop_codon:yes gene_type:complete